MLKTNTTPQKEANRLTKFWQEYGPNNYPLNLEELIKGALGQGGKGENLEVVYTEADSFEGKLEKTKNSNRWVIILNSDISNKRRLRFTFAHELGHYMCHRDFANVFEDTFENLNDFNNQIEQEANIFASWLLMPNNIVPAGIGLL